ncbi:MAG: N-acetylglucosamine kinase [Bacteroidota bacterium]
MLLVCDSGSTKADWLLYDGKDIKGPYHTMGFNPLFHSTEFVYQSLQNAKEFESIADKITEVKFFGAGCSSPSSKETIAAGLRLYFNNAQIAVEHDLLACAYATCGDHPGISCILGTGSNACWFDGVEVHESNFGLGYILGDEGSGSYLGKKLLTHYLYGMLPEEIANDFYETYHLDRNSIINHVYKEPNANVWLASFAKFIGKHHNHPAIAKIIQNSFRDFLTVTVCNYPDYKNKIVHFVGSIAFLYQHDLKLVADSMDIKIGKIIKQPINDLMNYYIQQ